jgi:hypothetical protein
MYGRILGCDYFNGTGILILREHGLLLQDSWNQYVTCWKTRSKNILGMSSDSLAESRLTAKK